MELTRRFPWLMILSGYGVLSVFLFFGEELLSSSERIIKPSMFERFFESGAAWVLGPSLNLIWKAPLYVVFYVIGTMACLAFVFKMFSARGWLARFAFGAALALTWSACGLWLTGPVSERYRQWLTRRWSRQQSFVMDYCYYYFDSGSAA